jgi:hypothetical protein
MVWPLINTWGTLIVAVSCCAVLCFAVLPFVLLYQAARKRGKDAAAVQSNLQALESILPNLINLHKMKAADWVSYLCQPD